MRQKRVMLCDDDSTTLKVLERFFTNMGYEVLPFGEPSVCAFDENTTAGCHHRSPCADIIITDYNMPRMSGLDLLEQQQHRGCQLPAKNKLVISGSVQEGLKDRINAIGCAFLAKPFSLSDLKAWVQDCDHRIDVARPLEVQSSALHVDAEENIHYSCSDQARILAGNIINGRDAGVCNQGDHSLEVEPCLLLHGARSIIHTGAMAVGSADD